jgi:hypothetical protein
MAKITTTRVPANSATSTKINYHPDNRGGAKPASHQPVPEVEPVKKIPFYQHTWPDGTVTAPSWTPDHIDANLDGPYTWNRSWDESQRQLNPHGDPPGRRSTNQIHTTGADRELPKPQVTGGPRRKVVGARQPKNPNASTKPANLISEDD